MKYLILGLALWSLAAPPPTPVRDDEAELRRLKQVIWPQAYRERDADLLDRILDADFVLVSDDGSWSTKVDELAGLSSATWPHDSFEFEIKRLDLYNDNTAIISGEGRATGIGAGKPYCLRYQSSNVLIRRDVGWRAVLSHVSGVETHCE